MNDSVNELGHLIYRVFIKYYVFSLFFIFLNSDSSAAALVFYLPVVCVQTLTPRENREWQESEYSQIFGKKHNI